MNVLRHSLRRAPLVSSATPLPAAAAAAAASVHSVAASGFGEGTNDHYDRARPSYPAGALQLVFDAVRRRAGLTLLEPGAGTGIFSRLLLDPPGDAYPDFRPRAVVGIEPSAGMRAAWDRGVERLPPAAREGVDVRCVDGSFDDFSAAGIERGTVDGVIIAQAWHWCPDHDAALREIASYLKPGAPLILVWNLESAEDEWHAGLRALYEPRDLGTPQYYRMLWRAMFDVPVCAELFGAPREAHVPWDAPATEDALVQRLFSKSYLTEAHLHGEARAQFERELRAHVRSDAPGKEWIDKEAGVFRYKYTTDIVVLNRK